ncbi:hypothetical protein [Kordia sp.]|uniref:hypothetical protein n=1 Tax=Kordia sp. TaxID=1965332 RepID=UPI0025C6B54D|nr:hypothetical protein [Kordia sp.]MCH2193621.1 hypothetical protein [Kordia sp.]
MKKFIGVIGGILILISVFLPSVTIGPISISFWDALAMNSTAYAFIAFGIIVALSSYLRQKWSNIIAVIVAIITLGLDLKYIIDASNIGLGSAGIGLWVCLIGAIMAIAGPFLKAKN